MFLGLNDVAFLAAAAGGAAPWTPADITTALWLDAADASTITEVSGVVSQWNDKSGNGRNVSQGTAGARPALTAANLNAKDVLTFDGGDSLASSVNFPLTGNAAFSIFYVAKKTTTGNGMTVGWGNTSLAGKAAGYYEDSTLRGLAFAGGQIYNTTSSQNNIWHIAAFTKLPGAINTTSQAFRNGADVAMSGHSSTTPDIASAPFAVGQWADFVAARFIGSMAEVIVTSSSASTFDRQRIEGYLAHKWGLTANLPNDHPYKTAAPTV
jgi:hypothetical protein